MKRWTHFLLIAGLLLAGCSRPKPAPLPEPHPQPEPSTPPVVYDVVIRGGTLLDGSGAPGAVGDVAIQGDRIVAVGKLGPYEAGRTIDATGLAVAPGFINPHSHTHDFINPFEEYDATASLMQGITTEVGGVDGRSPVPLGPWLDGLAAKGTGVNFATFIGQGSVRGEVMGSARGDATPAELERMRALVKDGMAAGAFGLSTGLEYQPGSFAKTAEIIELAKVVKPYGGLYSTHMRSEGAAIEVALDEALQVGREAGIPVNISHFKIVRPENWGKLDSLVKKVEEAHAKGERVIADVYPYLAPDYGVNRPYTEWAGVLPPEAVLFVKAKDSALVGQTLAAAAKAKGVTSAALQAEVLAGDPGARIVALVSSEAALKRFLAAPWSVISTDGEAQPDLGDQDKALLTYHFHRRSYGAYAQLFGNYVREQDWLTLEQAVRKATGAVAVSLGLKERGYLKVGYFADVVIFDPKAIEDKTTWLAPQVYPAGIAYVLVNGKLAVADGKRMQGRPGVVLRKEG
ncbi:MAG TPA: D-aminoacylase [Symbiobacteriaceae bacterium]|nr:D-aminoacylase [Symbiobacteriaceae bacterium]